MKINNLKIPTLIINRERCFLNIEKMVAKARRNNLIFRPHFKTHQSREISRMFKYFRVDRITVSSLGMADFFAADGWSDITVAFPVNLHESETINRLNKKITLNLLVEEAETVRLLNQTLDEPLSVFVKIDTGSRRTGIRFDNIEIIDEVLNAISRSEKLSFAGFLAHAGHSYSCRTRPELHDFHAGQIEKTETLRQRYHAQHPEMIISLGDTPTASVAENFEGVDEIRPGNFVFFDIMQYQISSCDIDDIAVSMAAPIVATRPERNEITLYCGAVHLSKEYIENEGEKIFGYIIDPDSAGERQILPGAYVSKLSQEHGIVHLPDEYIGKFATGDFVEILPVHSCLTMNLMKDSALKFT